MDVTALAVRYHANQEARRAAQVNALTDVWVVAGFDDRDRVLARPLTAPEATPTATPAIAGIRPRLGDEVMVQRLAGQWWITGTLTGGSGAAGLIHGEPIIVPPFVRDADAAGGNTWTGTTDFASVRTTVADLDPGTTYLVTADVDMYLSAAAGTTKVAAGVRIGFASDPGSVGSPQFGPGHKQTAPTLTRARFERVVSGVASIQVTGRAYASATGSHTIGDAALYMRLVPLVMTGRM